MSTRVPWDLDPVIHSRARLGIMVLLAEHGSMEHRELREALGLTDGNLATHISKLEAEGLVEVHKGFRGKRPRTVYEITQEGKRRLAEYVKALKELIKNLEQAED